MSALEPIRDGRFHCPKCDSTHIYHSSVFVLHREKEDEDGTIILVEKERHIKFPAKSDSFLGPRDEIRISLVCECGSEVWLLLIEHKGQTWVEWREAPSHVVTQIEGFS